MDLAIKIIAGGICGGAVGYLVSRMTACSRGACNNRFRPVYSVIGWAVFGAAVAWYIARRGT